MNVIADAEIERRAPDGGAAADSALVRAAMHLGWQLAGGVTHDLNSALQCLGDALFTIRDESRALVRPTHGEGGAPSESLEAPLTLADQAFDRLTAIARLIPVLVPRVSAEASRVDLARELRDIAAVTRTHWKNRVDLSVDVAPSAESFACVWWIARVAATSMVMSAAGSEPRTPNGTVRPKLLLQGAEWGATAEIRVRVSRFANDDALPIAVNALADVAQADATLALCARQLGGVIEKLHPEAGVTETVLTFPIQCVTAFPDSSFT